MEVHIERNYSKNKLEVWVFANQGNMIGNLEIDKETGWNEWVQFNPHEIPPSDLRPFLSLPLSGMLGSEILNAITQEAIKSGFKPANENLIEGKLLATEKHLDDMREITKHLLKINSK